MTAGKDSNRSMTDVAFGLGWKTYMEGKPMDSAFHKQTLTQSYEDGYEAAAAHMKRLRK